MPIIFLLSLCFYLSGGRKLHLSLRVHLQLAALCENAILSNPLSVENKNMRGKDLSIGGKLRLVFLYQEN
jgi:hypothetical protein